MKIYNLQQGQGIYWNDIPPTPGDVIVWSSEQNGNCYVILKTLKPNLFKVLDINCSIIELFVNERKVPYKQ